MSDSFKTTVDPLLKDLDEKKESFRRNVVCMAAELKQVRGRLVSQEQFFVKETLSRKEAETKAKKMETEICKLQKKLEDRNCQLEASTSAAEKFLEDVDDLRLQLALTKEIAETSAVSAQSAQLQCSLLTEQFDDKTHCLKEHEDRVTQLGHQLDNLQRDLETRECSQKQLRDEVMRIEREITEAVTKSRKSTECEFQKLLEEVSTKKFEKMNKLLVVKDEEISKLKDEIRLISVHWKLKTKELESQLEKQKRADQELKKKVLRLEFCLQEARSQTRKLQRVKTMAFNLLEVLLVYMRSQMGNCNVKQMGEKRDKAIKEIRDELSGKQSNKSENGEKQKLWDSSGFKIVVSMSMLILVIVSKR